MENKIWLKTQTNRSTQFKKNLSNINIGVSFNRQDFEVGICAVKYWGDFEPRETPLMTFEIEGISYQILLSDFIKKIKPILKKYRA